MSRGEADVLLGGRYRLTRRMAAGGMGHVWEAEDTVLHRLVAIKVLSEGLSSDPRSAERFRREAQAAAGLSHPNVAGVFDYGEDDGTQFIVMELLEGETLAQRIGRIGRLDPAEAGRIAGVVAAALEAAHKAGIVHRDVKPGNVMLTPQGEVKVLDFGIAAASGPNLTVTGFTIGTAAYLSPEQAAGERATSASDVYALGVVLYEMLSGRPPFTGETPVAVAAAHVSQEAPPLTDVVPGVPAHLALACQKAMAKDPALRPRTAGVFRQMLGPPDLATHDPSGELSEDRPASAQTTAVIPPADSTAVLPESQSAVVEETPPRPAPVRSTRPSRNRILWVLGAVVAGVVLLALILSSVLGGDLSSRRVARVKIPNVAGLGLAAAERKLDTWGLKVGEIKRVEGPVDTVVRTDPPDGASVASGTHVTLYVGPPPDTTGKKKKHGGNGNGHGGGDGGGD
jgi:eukaryotic-like serine/threonine-protein kinase